ncbi:MAG TPA: tripartite tricarboxylate transporter substrate binding protein [Xanthobacteraceae bacterium]|nr:tripartite tricarboxylate transporter substrate binding protein [Xanthobacteraceae bacterium]
MTRFAFLFLILSGITAALAEDYPSRPVMLVVPIGGGGPLDTTARLLAAKLGDAMGKPFVVENRPGGNTIVGTMTVAKADPDGHTLLVAPNASLTTNVAIFRKLPYDPQKDFIPIAVLASVPFLLVTGPALPVTQLLQLIAEAKNKPGQLTFASTGIGTVPHLAGEMLKSMAGIQMTHVPYRGLAPVLADVMGGQISMAFVDLAGAMPLVSAGKLHAVGVSSKHRLAELPNVPTIAEGGLPNFEAVGWNMILAPANTPPAVIEKLHAAVVTAMAQPDIQERMKTLGLIADASPGVPELRNFIAAEINRWGAAVRSAGIEGSE